MIEGLESIEFDLLLDGIYARYGYDFRDYSEASLKRRLRAICQRLKMPNLHELSKAFLTNPELFAATLPDFTVGTSEMFRDPAFYTALREKVVPVLRTYPAFKVWHAGCSTGEEVYSLAILLKEEGLYDRAVIYATDINERSLMIARGGRYAADSIKLFTENYQKSGGKHEFSRYYSAAYNLASFDRSLRENIVFSDHNLVTDQVFCEAHLILCRNVLIYFNRRLQNRALDLFTRSLRYKGFLCLGSKETVRFLNLAHAYDGFDESVKIFQKSAHSDFLGFQGEMNAEER